MLKINIVTIGKVKEKYICEGIKEFEKRLSRYIQLNIIELSEEDDNKGIEYAISKESEKILSFLQKKTRTYNILLDLKGKIETSEEMAYKIDEISLTYSEINFIIGGSNGVNENIRKYVDYLLSFSKMTFPHQLMRLILLEQIYRWIAINNNIKYHK